MAKLHTLVRWLFKNQHIFEDNRRAYNIVLDSNMRFPIHVKCSESLIMIIVWYVFNETMNPFGLIILKQYCLYNYNILECQVVHINKVLLIVKLHVSERMINLFIRIFVVWKFKIINI